MEVGLSDAELMTLYAIRGRIRKLLAMPHSVKARSLFLAALLNGVIYMLGGCVTPN